jgi:hypothetical protein
MNKRFAKKPKSLQEPCAASDPIPMAKQLAADFKTYWQRKQELDTFVDAAIIHAISKSSITHFCAACGAQLTVEKPNHTTVCVHPCEVCKTVN